MTLQNHAQAVQIRRGAAIVLEHAIARLGYWTGHFTKGDSDAVWLLQNAKWGIEAMDSPSTNRFWDEQRRDYHQMLADNGLLD